MRKSRNQYRFGIITIGAIVGSLILSFGSVSPADAHQRVEESTTTSTTVPATTTSSTPQTTTTSTVAADLPHDTDWAELTADSGTFRSTYYNSFEILRFTTSEIPPGSPISYSRTDGKISVTVSGYYQVSFSVFVTRVGADETTAVDQVTEWGLGAYGLTKEMTVTPLSQCSAPSNWFPFPSAKVSAGNGHFEYKYAYTASRTCIVKLDSQHQYGLFKLTGNQMKLALPTNENSTGGDARYSAPASLTMNLLDATP